MKGGLVGVSLGVGAIAMFINLFLLFYAFIAAGLAAVGLILALIHGRRAKKLTAGLAGRTTLRGAFVLNGIALVVALAEVWWLVAATGGWHGPHAV